MLCSPDLTALWNQLKHERKNTNTQRINIISFISVVIYLILFLFHSSLFFVLAVLISFSLSLVPTFRVLPYLMLCKNPVNLTHVNNRCFYLDRAELVILSSYNLDVYFSRVGTWLQVISEDGSRKWNWKVCLCRYSGIHLYRNTRISRSASTFLHKLRNTFFWMQVQFFTCLSEISEFHKMNNKWTNDCRMSLKDCDIRIWKNLSDLPTVWPGKRTFIIKYFVGELTK
jgi:uncharacterized protein with PQ loop repeat